jgi:hypothetical protein
VSDAHRLIAGYLAAAVGIGAVLGLVYGVAREVLGRG